MRKRLNSGKIGRYSWKDETEFGKDKTIFVER